MSLQPRLHQRLRQHLGSLRWRLLAGTVVALAVALLLAGLALSALFRAETDRQFDQGLLQQLDELTARVEFDGTGRIALDDSRSTERSSDRMTDPRWQLPYSGRYWQIDGAQTVGVLRSRSLWDATLQTPADDLPDGLVHRHNITGPQGVALRVLERTVHPADQPQQAWRLLVAADRSAPAQAETRFGRVLALSLGVLWCLLVAAAWAQVSVGLAPLRALQSAVLALREGRAARIAANAPTELLPLVQGFNEVLDRQDEMVERARQQAGNLAHAVKTPLTVMAQAAQTDTSPLGLVVREQTDAARRQVDWHLARARAAARKVFGAEAVALAPVVAGLLRVMERVHAERGLRLRADAIAPHARCACAPQDLQEMLGNLLGNACKWAHAEVLVTTEPQPGAWCLVVDDDGPGVAPARRAEVLERGTRLDETVPGSGLGLHIVLELATAYGGSLTLEQAPLGGLRARLVLPAAA